MMITWRFSLSNSTRTFMLACGHSLHFGLAPDMVVVVHAELSVASSCNNSGHLLAVHSDFKLTRAVFFGLAAERPALAGITQRFLA